MKTAFIFFVLGVFAGIAGWRYYERTENPTLAQRADDLVDKARDAAADGKAAVASKTEDWKLSSDNIKDELAKTGQVVRSKARTAGDFIDDARIVAVIKGKYVIEKDLSAFAITVDCKDGQVRLTGSVNSPDNIGRAVKIALETSGVHDVFSRLVVKN